VVAAEATSRNHGSCKEIIMTNAAYTMLEVIIATLILAVMLTGVTQSMISGSMLVEAVSQQAELTNNSNAAIHHLSQELRGADVDYVYYSDVGGCQQWSFNICTGFNDDGTPIYDEGDYGRLVSYDSANQTLTLTTQSVGGTSWVQILGTDVTDFGIAPVQGSLLSDNFLTISLSRNRYDRISDQAVEVATSRKVFLRSTNYNTDGFIGAPAVPPEAQPDEPEQPQEPLPDEPQEPLSDEPDEPQGPTVAPVIAPAIAWGTDSGNGSNVSINNTIALAEGMSLDVVNVLLSGQKADGLSWSQNGNVVSITGKSNKAFDVTISATASNAAGESATTTLIKRYN